MNSLRTYSLGLGVALAMIGTSAHALDLKKAEDAQLAMLKITGDISGKDVFKDWTTNIFAVVPGEAPKLILRMQGYNVLRLEKQKDGSWKSMSREVSYYQDVKTGKIIGKWLNPYIGEEVDVVQVANDPVNASFPSPKPNEKGPFENFVIKGEVATLQWDIPLRYPNALQGAEFEMESTGTTYLASEHFLYFANPKDVVSDKTTTTPVHYAWFRTGPWLPWMKMGQRPGYLIYSGNGKKLKSFDELPAEVREFTLKNFSAYTQAPKEFVTPNETSWSYYKKLKQTGQLPGPNPK
ncbi:DUF1838 family protein [Denitratisoma oestradiolicum]|uniref:DUF1838 domain-containing protein n=1 Tax=Denitratisoma oestradiolicum TaxID=311182 RepID=A0A6S6Y2M1_9PROT|nr:DUF1838 family protein [Denitratisoma oestradiolicum]TWO79168.1 hypothetical protein CBW56_16310 [Denitratisoma oestradiolicum]CAB1369573.1 conserved exported protein of unknown function [Denitratisoma oestradiolicum]